MSATTAIVDYGMCNLGSVARAVEECGGRPVVTAEPAVLSSAARIILPGVGAFPDGMKNLRTLGLDVVLRELALQQGIPLLGICLGMQLLATKGWEGQETPGLDLVAGEVHRLVPTEPGIRIPHIGWNQVDVATNCSLFEGIPPGRDFYFVHSYHLICRSSNAVVGRTPYCGSFIAAVQQGSVFGVQFHPEKSQRVGFQVLRNFLSFRPC